MFALLYREPHGSNPYTRRVPTVSRVQVPLWGDVVSPGWHVRSDALAVTIADLGAHVASVALVEGDREMPVSVPYPADAVSAKGYHGATVGRYANRIAKSRFVLDDREYVLTPNEGPNQLHGGPRGFSSQRWTGDAETMGGIGRVELHLESPAGDQGFPGTVSASAVFDIVDASLTITYLATSDAATPINLTNHTYWNLAGGGSLDGHQLAIGAASYVAVDDANIPVAGPPTTVTGTRFDCGPPRDVSQIVANGGYDHCFALDPDVDIATSLTHPSGRRLDVTTNQVGLQVYTGQHLDPQSRGIALETQCHPDTPNRPDLGDCTLRPGATYRNTTTFRFSQ